MFLLKLKLKMETIDEIEEVRDLDTSEDDLYENGDVPKITLISKLSSVEITNYINSIKTASVHWYNSFNPINNNDLTEDEQIWIEKLNRIGIAYFRPLVCASFMRSDISLMNVLNYLRALKGSFFLHLE